MNESKSRIRVEEKEFWKKRKERRFDFIYRGKMR